MNRILHGTPNESSFAERTSLSFLSEREVRLRARFSRGVQEMNRLFLCALLCSILLASSRYFGWGRLTSAPSRWTEFAENSRDPQTEERSTTNPTSNSAASPVRELIERWCAAYGDLNEKAIAALESPDFEIVDRFGELHVTKQRPDQEGFWAEGFRMIRREDFHPEYAIEEIRSIRPDVIVVHVAISYPGGIPLKGGDYIPAFSEIHTFIVSRDEGVWRIAGHNVTMRGL
jgi:Domain of unknown function (DUF4440)